MTDQMMTDQMMTDQTQKPARETRRGRDWRGAWRSLRTLIADTERTDAVFDLIEALEKEPDDSWLDEVRADARGRSLLEQRPNLVAHLNDRDTLARLSEGSFGRTYFDFVTRNKITADGLIEADEGRGDKPFDEDEARAFMSARGRDSHDLWHVLTGYGTDEAGELSVLAFTYGQYPSLGILLIVLAGALLGPKDLAFSWQRYLWRAYRRGKAAELDLAPYEEWLPLDLSEVRRRAGIEEPEVAHPGGVIAGGRDSDGIIEVAA